MLSQIQEQIILITQKAISQIDELLSSVEDIRREFCEMSKVNCHGDKPILKDELDFIDALIKNLCDVKLFLSESLGNVQKWDVGTLDNSTLQLYAKFCEETSPALFDIVKKLQCIYADRKFEDGSFEAEVFYEDFESIKCLCRDCFGLVSLYIQAKEEIEKRASILQRTRGGTWHGGGDQPDSFKSSSDTYIHGSPGTGKSRFLERLKRRIRPVDKGDKASDINSGPAPQPSCSVQSASPFVPQKDNIKSIYGDTKDKDTDSNVPTIDKVQFSAVAPETVTPGKYIPINIVVYEDEFRSVVDSIIESRGDNVTESKKGSKDVERNSRIRVVLSSPDVTVDDDCPEQIWNGKYLDFEFAVRIPKDFSEEQILFTASVYINDVIATKLNMILDCTAKADPNLKITRRDIMSAFVSYASHDRFRVATVIQGMKMARPDMNIFFDIESLRSGQRWESSLMEEIDSRDVLYLCWSRSAKESEWVEKEWRYALRTKGEECIEPIPIDSPDICPPPEELYQKHFNDKMLFVIKATEPPQLNGPCIIRFSTGDVISLDKEITVIGRDKARVDLCVDGNSAVSRIHCKLVYRNGAYYITDEGSANGTYVNGEKLPPKVETAIPSESVIKLVNEIFEIVY